MSFDFLRTKVEQQELLNLKRRKVLVEQQNARHLVIDGRQYLNFSSNDYLGLNHHPEINKALAQGVEKFGSCSSASSLISGYQYAHQRLEEKVCQWLNKPKCLLFNSGFSANQAVLSSLANDNVAFYLDKLSHASLIDGAFGQNGYAKRFKHNDYAHLDRLLTSSQFNSKLVVSEGVFSMDGDSADTAKLGNICQTNQAKLYIDDAHAIGIKGKLGQGSVADNADIDIVMATCGKAIATSGAFIACDNDLHDFLVNFARHYIYSTAMSPANAWATVKSIELIEQEAWRRDKIKHLSQLFSTKLDQHIKLLPTDSSIHAIVLGDERQTINAANELKAQGIWLTAIRPPTVAKGTSRLRVTICSSHKEKDINYLAESINKVIQ